MGQANKRVKRNVGLALHLFLWFYPPRSTKEYGMTVAQFREKVRAYIERHGISHSRFGRDVLGDPAWVSRLMAGAEPKEATREKVLAAMKAKVLA